MKKCYKKHLTTLHGLKIEKKTTSRDKTNNENISANNTLVQEGDESGRMLSYGSSPVVETYAMLDSCIEGTFIEKGFLKDFEILGWCPVGPVLPHGEKVPL